jgi:hypothetical protein
MSYLNLMSTLQLTFFNFIRLTFKKLHISKSHNNCQIRNLKHFVTYKHWFFNYFTDSYYIQICFSTY